MELLVPTQPRAVLGTDEDYAVGELRYRADETPSGTRLGSPVRLAGVGEHQNPWSPIHLG
jgi:hypothetical protein